MYNYLLNVSIVTRWILFIVPVMAIVWIPGILGFTAFPDGRVSYHASSPPRTCFFFNFVIDMERQTDLVVHLALRGLGW